MTQQTYISYIAIECKTNLDKTMFQEACATANDTKYAVAGARYYLLCEWLDMTPQSTAPTDIDEIIIMRKAKRMNSNVRSQYSTAAGRQRTRANYVQFLQTGVCQGSCRVSHFLSGLFILSLRVQIYRPDGCPIACAA